MAGERVFVGRARELKQLGELLDGVVAGRGALALIAGEAGIGKTRLASHLAASAEARGFRVVWGRCWEAGGAPAYFPWTQVFSALALPDPFDASGTTAGDASELRFRRHAAGAAALLQTSATTPVAIMLDDLHAADVSSLGFLQALARSVTHGRVLVVGTYREIEARLGETGALLAKIGREGDVLALSRLSREETIAWVRAVSPSASEDDAVRVCDATEGNPLFVHEVLRASTRLDVRRLPSGLAAVINEHVQRLPAAARETLSAASVFGRELVASDVAALAELDADRVASDLHAACEAGLIEPVSGRADTFAFSHVLVRDQLYAQLAPSRRAALHWRAGSVVKDLSLAANHLLAGRAAGDVRRAAEVAHDAAQVALAKLAFEAASRLAASALEALGDDRSAIACRLELIHAEALMVLGEGDRGRALCVRAADLARRLGESELIARAGLVYGTNIMSASVDPMMVRLLREGLAALADSTDDKLRARVMSRLGMAITPPTPETLEESILLARKAKELALRTGDLRTELRVLFNGVNTLFYRLPLAERDAHVDRTVELATMLGDDFVLLAIGPIRFANLRARGRADEADRVLADFEDRARAIPSPQYQFRVPMLRATRELLAGNLDAARNLGNEGLAIAQRGQIRIGELAWAQHRVSLAMLGDTTSIAADADRLISYHPRSMHGIAAWIYAASGRLDEARSALSVCVMHAAHAPSTLLGGEAAIILGDGDVAERAYEVLGTTHAIWDIFWGGPPLGTVIGPAARIAADLAAFLGRADEARVLYTRAIAVAERAGAPPLVALAERGLAALGGRSTSAPSVSQHANARATLSRTGDHWTLVFEGRTRVLKPRRGLEYIARLLADPKRDLHVLELAGEEMPRERGAPILDAKAKAAYRERLDGLRDIADGPDPARAARAREEIDAIAHELSRALGLGGRDRMTTTAADRARVAVTLAIRRAIEAIAEHEPALAGHLDAGIRTGAFCVYRPDPRASVTWEVVA